MSRRTKIDLAAPLPCARCSGLCCSTQAGYKFVRLTYQESRRVRFKNLCTVHPEAGVRGFFFEPEKDGKPGWCPFFDHENKRCGIYEQRPKNCREFDCRRTRPDSPFFKNAEWRRIQPKTHEP